MASPEPTIADILLARGVGLPNFDKSGKWSPPETVRAATPGFNPDDTIADDAKAAAASAVDPLGIPSAAVGLYSPGARDAWRGTYESRPFAGTVGGVVAPFGAYAKGAKAAGEALEASPKLSTAILAGMGMTGGSDEAAPATLTKRQQREIELENTRKGNDQARELEAERVRGELEVKKGTAQAEADRAQKEADRQRQAQIDQDERNKPFREKYAPIADKLPAVGLAAAMGIPYAGKVVSQFVRSAPARMLSGEVAATRAAAAAKDVDAVSTTTPTMASILKDYKTGEASMHEASGVLPSLKRNAGAAVVGGGLSAEGTMFPDQWDAAMLPDGKGKDDARERAMNPMNYLERGAMGAMTGIGGLHIPVYAKTPETAIASGLIKKYGTTPESAAKAIYASPIAEAKQQATLSDVLRKGLQPAPQPLTAQARPTLPGPPGQPSAPAVQAGIEKPQAAQTLPAPGSKGPPPPEAAVQSSGTPSGSHASGSEPSLSKALKGENAPHWERQNRDSGRFSGGFKGETE
jgi:hypothetical protein